MGDVSVRRIKFWSLEFVFQDLSYLHKQMHILIN